MSLDALEKSLVNMNSQAPSSRPSVTASESDWYINKRSSRSSRCSRSSASSNASSNVPARAAVTPLPPSIEVPLAILTGGLSVAAYHSIKSISERRASKKLASQKQDTDLSRAESLLVPSLVPEQIRAGPAELPVELPTTNVPIVAELESPPQDLPPVYSEKPRSISQGTPSSGIESPSSTSLAFVETQDSRVDT